MRKLKTIGWQRAAAVCAAWLLLAPATNADAVAADPGVKGAAGTLKVIGAYPEERGVGHTVTGLAGGQVLVYGHSGDISAIDSVYLSPKVRHGMAAQRPPLLWDPKQRGWQQLDNPPECTFSHYLHTSTALASGKVLIAGGLCDPPRRHNNVDVAPPYRALSLWNNVSHAWEKAPELTEARIYHSATLLADDSVLLAGGESDRRDDEKVEPVLASAELWRDGKIALTGPMIIPRAKHTATRLADGSVLVAGGIGRGGKAITFVERWNPATQRWTDAPPLTTGRTQHSATLLDDGRVMVAGGIGIDGKLLSSVEILDAQQGAWSAGAPLLLPLHRMAAQALPGGDVLVIGTGRDHDHTYASAMLWSKASAEWRPAGRPYSDRFRDQQTYALVPAAPNGSALLVFDYRLVMRWTPSQAGPNASSVYGERIGHTSTVLKDGRVMLAAGRVMRFGSAMGDTALDWVELYDATTDQFALTGRLKHPKEHPVALALAGGGAVVADVGTLVQLADNPPSLAEAWDPATGRWSPIPGLTAEAASLQLDAFGQLDDGRVMFVLSSFMEHEKRNVAKIWNPNDNAVESIPLSIKGVAAAVSPTGRVLLMPPEYSAEVQAPVWDSRSGAVEVLKTPDGVALEHMDALVLKNGNVVLMPGRNYSSARGARMVTWLPTANRLQSLPPLPTDMQWSAYTRQLIELVDGTLATDGYRLKPDATAWTAAPRYPQEAAKLAPLQSGRLLALSVVAPHTAYVDLATSDWRVKASHFLRRKETMPPALLELSDGQLMVAGSFDRSGWPQETTVQLWDPKSGLWSDGEKPLGVYVARLQAIRLPSGKVMLLGRDRDQNLGCEIGHPREQRWSACGPSTPVRNGEQEFTVGTLDDGRVALVFGADAYAYSEQTALWSPLPAPLPAMKMGGSGVATTRVPLPDGCAISGPPLRIFDPKTQTESLMTLPTGVRAQRSSLAVLTDGTVILVGQPDGAAELGYGFFHRKASCAGFVPLADDAADMPGTVVPTTTSGNRAGAAGGNALARLGKQIWAVKWWFVALLAGGMAFMLHRRERLRLQEIDAQTDPRLKNMEPVSTLRNDGRPARALAGESGPGRGMLYLGIGIAVIFLLLVRPGPMASWFGNADKEQPCHMVGVWLSSRSGSDITLNADGSYITAFTADENGIERIYQGTWKVKGDKFIWTHFGKHDAVTEANPIKEESDGHFTLIEENGDATRFKLQKTVASTRCTH